MIEILMQNKNQKLVKKFRKNRLQKHYRQKATLFQSFTDGKEVVKKRVLPFQVSFSANITTPKVNENNSNYDT